MKRILSFIIVFYISFFLYGKITMKDVILKGIKKNYSISNQKIEKRILHTEKLILTGEKFFDVRFSGAYLYRSVQPEINIPSLNSSSGIIPPYLHIIAGTKNIFDFNFSIRQPIYTGGILSGRIKLNEIKSLQNEYKKSLLENNLKASIKICYLDYRFLVLQKKYLNLFKKDLENHILKLNEYFREQLIKKSDIFETELKFEEIKMNIRDIESKIIQKGIEFKELTGVDITEVDNRYREDILDYNDSIDYLKKNHPIVKNIENSIKMIILDKKIEKGKYLPQISGFGEIHYGKPGIDFFKDNWSFYFQGGINISLKLFDWGKSAKKSKISDYSIEKLENQKRDFLEKSEKNLKTLYYLKKNIEKKLIIADKLFDLSKENSVLKEKLFKEKQEDNMNYISSLLKKEAYSLLKNQLLIKLESVKVNINKIIGRN